MASPTSLAESDVPTDNARETEEEKQRRLQQACIPCHLSKRKCDHVRPCGPCCARGMEVECLDKVKEVLPACTVCKKRKLKCDRKRPCGRCTRQGKTAQCVIEGDRENRVLPVKRRPDSDISQGDGGSSRGKSKREVPSAALRGGHASTDEDSMESDFSPDSCSSSAHPIDYSCSSSPCPDDSVASASFTHRERQCIVAPERPIAFPDGMCNGYSFVVPEIGADNPWPTSLVRLFKTYRTADTIYQRMLHNMSPKLLSTVLRIFRAMDGVFVSTNNDPTPPREWRQTDSWQSSLRCGMQTVRVDKAAGVLTGVDVNPFWTDLAGLHKEEFISRAFAGEMSLPTSELRQASKLIIGMKKFIKLKIAQQTNTAAAAIESPPIYGRFTRDWGRGNMKSTHPAAGVLTRLRLTTSADPQDPSYMRLQNSLVVVSAEEFEAVRAQQPELCEGYLVPVVGSKSAQELMDPRLLVQESFQHMNSCAEGRAQMDRLADVLDKEFRFMFDYLAQRPPPQPAQTPLPLPSTLVSPIYQQTPGL